MRWFILILFNILLSQLSGQTIDKLDEKNGFKDFSLGDSYSKWQIQLKYDGSWDDGSKAYIYSGLCCQKVFEYPVDRIVLRFYDERLIGIYITTEKFQREYSYSGEYTRWRPDDFESLKASFSYLFGKPSSIETPKETGEIKHIWAGKKVILISSYQYLGIKDGDRQQIVIADLTYIEKVVEKGF